jgi:RNA polymerase sigma-70 factor (ECF subfamily)
MSAGDQTILRLAVSFRPRRQPIPGRPLRAHQASEGIALSAEEDPCLAESLARGEACALERLVARYQNRVAQLAHRLLGWRGDVEDVVQEVFLAAWKQARRFRGDSTVWTWLTAITIRQCRMQQRREARRRRWMRFFGRRGDAEPADMAVVRDEAAQRVRRAMQKLSVADRELLVLHHFEGCAAAQLAQMLGISVNAAEVRLHRARQRLRKALT